MNSVRALIVAGLLSGAGPALAQDAAALVRCPTIRADAERLACFDAAMRPKHTAAASAYQQMDLIDFKTDAADLVGKRVEVTGYAVNFAGHALLATKPGDVSTVPIEIDDLPREERRRLVSCANFCRVTVQGVGAVVLNQNGIHADALSVR